MLKRQVPIIIVMLVGLVTLFGHFFENPTIKNFVDNDSTQWFDIIASFAIFLGALNLLKMQLRNVFRKGKNWQYSVLAVLGFFFAIYAGFLTRAANYVELSNIDQSALPQVTEIIADATGQEKGYVQTGIDAAGESYKIKKTFIRESGATELAEKLAPFAAASEVKSHEWGAHMQTQGSLFNWMFVNIFTPLSATMFALLAFYVASASYRAFRIRNFEATLLLLAGIILMLGRVPLGQLISAWFIAYIAVLGVGALIAPLFRDRRIVFAIVAGLAVVVTNFGFVYNWEPSTPGIFYLPRLQEWIFNVPTVAGARAIMIGIGLGIVGTSFRIIIGIERSFLGE